MTSLKSQFVLAGPSSSWRGAMALLMLGVSARRVADRLRFGRRRRARWRPLALLFLPYREGTVFGDTVYRRRLPLHQGVGAARLGSRL